MADVDLGGLGRAEHPQDPAPAQLGEGSRGAEDFEAARGNLNQQALPLGVEPHPNASSDADALPDYEVNAVRPPEYQDPAREAHQEAYLRLIDGLNPDDRASFNTVNNAAKAEYREPLATRQTLETAYDADHRAHKADWRDRGSLSKLFTRGPTEATIKGVKNSASPANASTLADVIVRHPASRRHFQKEHGLRSENLTTMNGNLAVEQLRALGRQDPPAYEDPPPNEGEV